MNNLIITSQGILQKTDDFTLESKDSQVIYEVLRIIDGIPLFVENHFERLINSLHIKGIQMDFDFSEFKRAIHELVKSKHLQPIPSKYKGKNCQLGGVLKMQF